MSDAARALEHYHAGNALHELGRHAEALVEFDHSIALDEGRAETWVNRGIVLFALGRSDDARSSFDRGIELDPALANAYRCKAILLEQLGDQEAAVAMRRKVIELSPSAGAFIDLAYTLRAGVAEVVHWQPGGVEEQIVDAVEQAIVMPCTEREFVWAWAERVMRLGRIAHGRQASARAGLAIDPAPAIARYREAAGEAVQLFADDPWFAAKLADAAALSC